MDLNNFIYLTASNFLICVPPSFTGRHTRASYATRFLFSVGPVQMGARTAKNRPKSTLPDPDSSKTESILSLMTLTAPWKVSGFKKFNNLRRISSKLGLRMDFSGTPLPE
uniref:Uncharacterized protein n=1 Tax=Cucumis sativus TaxID=3659 RepID=A0A0A0LY33_CUCSA